ncbi:MAG: hypothetical protein JWR16_14 [Nevskia sp.]|nr:hypothetical protein [Nevskia sp.]
MKVREPIYAVLALLGLVGTWHYNLQYLAQQGASFDLYKFLRFGFVNPAAASMTIDLTVAFIAFAIWVVPEARRVGMRGGWLYPLLGFFVAFSFAFPLFLCLRERHLRLHVVSAGGS